MVEVIAAVGCLIDCLGFDLFLMTKELCSILLSPCSNEVSFGKGRTHHLRRRWRSQSWQDKMNISNVIRTVLSERCKANLTNPNKLMCITNNQALLLEDGLSFPPTSALTSGGR